MCEHLRNLISQYFLQAYICLLFKINHSITHLQLIDGLAKLSQRDMKEVAAEI